MNTQRTRRTAVFRKAKLKFYGSPVLRQEDRGRCKELVQILLEKGADVNARDKDGRTALMRCLEPSIEVVADSVRQSEEKGTALTLKIKNGTVRIKWNLPTEIVEFLKAHGAKE
ncbi:MAG: ankyrin repeat domain-containing protein [Desulfomonilaceae bacterium]